MSSEAEVWKAIGLSLNSGELAFNRGRAHALNIYRLHGKRALRKLVRYKPENDYELGKIKQAKEILEDLKKAGK